MEECCDNKNIIFTDYYVCVSCGVIHGYRFISCYENENNLNKNLFQNLFIKG